MPTSLTLETSPQNVDRLGTSTRHLFLFFSLSICLSVTLSVCLSPSLPFPRPCSVQRLVYDAKAVLLLLFGSIHDGVTRLTSGAASSLGAVFVAPLVIVERLLNANICVVTGSFGVVRG